jgi:hypothetical protein
MIEKVSRSVWKTSVRSIFSLWWHDDRILYFSIRLAKQQGLSFPAQSDTGMKLVSFALLRERSGSGDSSLFFFD